MLLQTVHTLIDVEPRADAVTCTVPDTVCALDGRLPDTIVSAVPLTEDTLHRLETLSSPETVESLRAVLAFADREYRALLVAFSQRTEWAEVPDEEGANIILTRKADTAELRMRDAAPHVTVNRVHTPDAVYLSFHRVDGQAITFSSIRMGAH